MVATLPALFLVSCLAAKDPAPGLAHTKTWSRGLECERLTAQTGNQRYPGVVGERFPRGDILERDAVVCRQRLTRPGLRTPREDAVLSALEATTTALAETAASLRPDLADRTWLVEAFDPSAAVGEKLAFASKNALMRRGLQVSDRSPLLSAGDVDVITRMAPDLAYPTACLRWSETGSLGDGDALLALVTRDPRETIVHAGLCVSGTWTWLR